MAKVTAPLFSFTAGGQLAKSIVYSRWKGIADVRSFVIPANPRSSSQTTQRSYFSQAVEDYHLAGRTVTDNAAMDRSARFAASPQSGFNYFVAQDVNWERFNSSLSGAPVNSACALSYPDATHFDFNGTHQGDVASAVLAWGYSPGALDQEAALTVAGSAFALAAPVVRNSDAQVYAELRVTPAAGAVERLGIYTL